MYLGYQNGKIKFYTEQPLDQAFYNLDKVEETDLEYVLDGEEYVLKDEAWEEKQAQERREEFNKAFFKTSLGYIRREVSMLDATTKTFLTDMLPQLIVGFPILAYEEPDFTIENVNMVNYQKQVIVTEEFLKECKDQLIIDFYGFNPMETNGEE